MEIIVLAIIAGGVALAFAGILTLNLLKNDEGDETVRFIGKAIREGAMAFLKREYTFLAIFVVVMFVVLLLFVGIYAVAAASWMLLDPRGLVASDEPVV